MISGLWRGQYGLAATCWLFGVLGGILVNVVSLASSVALSLALGTLMAPAVMDAGAIGYVLALIAWALAQMVVLCFNVAYTVVVSVGVVRAASAYPGFRLWAWLATSGIAVYWLWLAMTLATMIGAFRDAPGY